jgi:ATP-dependent Clp protease ATP-binding subunit ClpB
MSLKKEYEDAKSKIEKLQTEGDFEKASKLMYVTIPKLEVEIKDFEEKINKENKLVKDSVTSNEIAEVISKATGIPLNKVVASEKEKLLKLGDELKKYVKGQDVAVEIVANAILRGRAGINDPNKPIGSFLFMGSTGVGKTQLAKAIAKELFDNENSIVRVDMSEYMEKHSVSKLLGAPPGYVGYDQPGYLTEEVRRKPYSVVLLDEIEKAHGDVLNVLLQVLDDGRLKDSQGRVINFKNTLIIMTSNIGSNEIIENKKDEALKELKRYLKPEFINRIDEIVIFNPIDEETIKKIIKQKLDELISRVKEQDYIISFSDNIIEKIKENGYEAQFGARPIKRYIQKNIENELAKLILENKIEKGKKYILGINKAGEYQIKDDKKN